MNNDQVISSLVAVKLSRSFWDGKVDRKDKARQLENTENTRSRIVTTKVKVLPTEFASRVGVPFSKVYQFWKENSLPWEDEGWRVVTATKFLQLQDGIDRLMGDCKAAVEWLLDNYEQAREAARHQCGNLFRDDDFPSQSDLRTKYAVSFDFRPIQSVKDARIEGMRDDLNDTMRRKMKADYDKKLEATVSDIIARVGDLLRDLQKRLVDDKQDGVKYGGWAKMAKRIIEAVDGLNVTGNQTVEAVLAKTRAIADELSGAGAESVRQNHATRAGKIAKVNSVLDEIANFGA